MEARLFDQIFILTCAVVVVVVVVSVSRSQSVLIYCICWQRQRKKGLGVAVLLTADTSHGQSDELGLMGEDDIIMDVEDGIQGMEIPDLFRVQVSAPAVLDSFVSGAWSTREAGHGVVWRVNHSAVSNESAIFTTTVCTRRAAVQ